MLVYRVHQSDVVVVVGLLFGHPTDGGYAMIYAWIGSGAKAHELHILLISSIPPS